MVNSAAVFDELLDDRPAMISTVLEIENKQRELVPLQPNRIQADMLETSTWRDVYVKPASVGATTIWVGDFLLDNLIMSGTVSCIVSYDEWVAQRQLLKAKKMYTALKRRFPSIPRLEHKAAHHLSFINEETDFESSFYIYSARSYTIGRGEAIHNLLLDEYAFWPVGTHSIIGASAMRRVPISIDTKIRILSTANGSGDPFHDTYGLAKEGKEIGRSTYKAHFYPWFIHEEYVMKADDPMALPMDQVEPLRDISPVEESLILRILDDGQSEQTAMDRIRWRRYTVVDVLSLRRSGETIFIFEQEFPEDDETCFVVAGDMAFDADIISTQIGLCFPAPMHTTVMNQENKKVAGVDIWEDVEPDQGYVLSIDPGKGKISESVGQVWKFIESYEDKEGDLVPAIMRHCATIAGWYDEWEMAEFCMPLGDYYNGAAIVPEDNLDIVAHLRHYHSLYYTERIKDGVPTMEVGWQMNTATKQYMITELNRHLEEIDCKDERFWEQARHIRRSPTVKGGIIVQGADDHLDAGGIAIACRDAQPRTKGYVGNTGDDGGWGDDWGK